MIPKLLKRIELEMLMNLSQNQINVVNSKLNDTIAEELFHLPEKNDNYNDAQQFLNELVKVGVVKFKLFDKRNLTGHRV